MKDKKLDRMARAADAEIEQAWEERQNAVKAPVVPIDEERTKGVSSPIASRQATVATA